MKARVSGISLGACLLNISKMFDKVKDNSFRCYVKISTFLNGLNLQAINDRVTFNVYLSDVDADVEETFLVDARILVSFFKNHKNIGDITISTNDKGDFKIRYGNNTFKCPWFKADTYPQIFVSDNFDITVNSNYFVPYLKRSFSFTDNNEFRPAIEMTMLKVKQDYIEMVSTDLFRMFVNRSNHIYSGNEKEILISEEAASILYGFLDGCDTDVKIGSDEKRTYIKFDDILITDIGIEGKYPSYERIINSYTPSSSCESDRDKVLHSLSAMSLVNGTLTVGVNKDGMKIVRENAGARQSLEENVDCKLVNGDPFVFSIKLGSLVSSIRDLQKGVFIMEYSDASKMVKVYNPEHPNTYILNQSLVNY